MCVCVPTHACTPKSFTKLICEYLKPNKTIFSLEEISVSPLLQDHRVCMHRTIKRRTGFRDIKN